MRRAACYGGLVLLGLGTIAGAAFGYYRLDVYVDGQVSARRPEAAVEFVNLPEPVAAFAGSDLRDSLSNLFARNWTDQDLCRDIAQRLSSSAWVAQVHYVRRGGSGRFEINARYRVPKAMVQQDHLYVLVDTEGVRVPGVYPDSTEWKAIYGVARAAPPPGELWEGEDLKAGLSLLAILEAEPFRGQIKGVLVENHAGRRDPRATHITLVTDRTGGRIRWGSAPGFEMEENIVPQKLALLRENYGRTGRADADHTQIDVSTFPDRYTVPG